MEGQEQQRSNDGRRIASDRRDAERRGDDRRLIEIETDPDLREGQRRGDSRRVGPRRTGVDRRDL